jgi:hypothetical protein
MLQRRKEGRVCFRERGRVCCREGWWGQACFRESDTWREGGCYGESEGVRNRSGLVEGGERVVLIFR